jgi:branched-chain amino acid transport system substrate-binding protein
MYSTPRGDRTFLLAAFFLVTVTLTSCSGRSGEHSDAAAILIGAYGPLTGGMATQGISTQNGIAMAQDKVNNTGGVLGRKIRVIVEDDRGLPEEAQTVVARLITKYGVSAILGETTSSRTLAAAPIAQQNHIPMITPDATNPRVTKVGDYIFRTSFTDAVPSSLMAKFVSKNLGIKKLPSFVISEMTTRSTSLILSPKTLRRRMASSWLMKATVKVIRISAHS